MKKNFKIKASEITNKIEIDAETGFGSLPSSFKIVLVDNNFIKLKKRPQFNIYNASTVIGRVEGLDNTFVQGVRIGHSYYTLYLYDLAKNFCGICTIVEDEVTIVAMEIVDAFSEFEEQYEEIIIKGKQNSNIIDKTPDEKSVELYKNFSNKNYNCQTISELYVKDFCTIFKAEEILYTKTFDTLLENVRIEQMKYVMQNSEYVTMNLLSRSRYILECLKNKSNTQDLGALVIDDEHFLLEVYRVLKEDEPDRNIIVFDEFGF